MARPKPYFDSAGKRVPSVTTVISGIGWNKDPLMHWANRQGLDGKTLEESRQAADVGTIVHAMIEAHRHGRTVDLSNVDEEMRDLATTAFDSYLRWTTTNVVEVLADEHRMVSDEYGYGGTLDRVHINSAGQVCLPDWKTSAGIYPDHLMQIAAYGRLWNEKNPTKPIEVYELLRLSKVSGAFDHHSYPAKSIVLFDEAFLVARKLYGYRYQLEKMMK